MLALTAHVKPYQSHHFLHIMIDLLCLSGLTGPVKATDWDRFEQIAFLKNSHTKFKKTCSYHASPFTGAQFDMTPTDERHRSDDYWRLTFRLPVAAVFAGQNVIHEGAENIVLELKAIEKFLRCFLLEFEFIPAEVDYFVQTMRIESAELTWHIRCSSQKAARAGQRRLERHAHALRPTSTHAYHIERVHVEDTDGRRTLYLHTRGGRLKCYIKVEQAQCRSKAGRGLNFLSDHMKPYRDQMLKEVSSDLRLEAVLEKELLSKHGLQAPAEWTEKKVHGAIADLWGQLGLDSPFVNTEEAIVLENLHPNICNTAKRYFAKEAPESFLSDTARTRHGAVLRELGLEIGVPWTVHKKELSGSIGKQLRYDKRRGFPDAMRRLALCMERLNRLIAFMDERTDYLVKSFSQERYDMRDRERRQRMFMSGNKDQYVHDAAVGDKLGPPQHSIGPTPSQGPRQPMAPRQPAKAARIGRGIGSVPVDPNAVDELIYVDGEPRVV
jgi:hypothetical protein